MKTRGLYLAILFVAAIFGFHPSNAQEVDFELIGQYGKGPCHALVLDGELSYIMNGSLFEVIDISDPTNPQPLGSYQLPANATELILSGNFVYACLSNREFVVMDVSDQNNPVPHVLRDFDEPLKVINIANGRLYGADDSGNFRVLDVSDPADPVSFLNEVGRCVYSEGLTGNPRFIEINGDAVYLTVGEQGLYTFNISNPFKPEPTDHDPASAPPGYSHMDQDGTTLVVTHNENGIRLFSIADKFHPVEISFVPMGEYGNAIAIYNDIIVATCWTEPIQLIDISDPNSPDLLPDPGFIPNGTPQIISITDQGILHIANGLGSYTINTIDENNIITQIGFYLTGIEGSAFEIVGDYLYYVGGAGSGGENEIRIIDITDPTNMNEVGIWTVPSSVVIQDIQFANDILYVLADDFFTVNIDSPTNLEVIGQTHTGKGTVRKIKVHGSKAYVLDWYSGIDIYDVSDPENPHFLYSRDLTGIPDNFREQFGFEIVGDYAYITDIATGLHVFNLVSEEEETVINIEGVQNLRYHNNKIYLVGPNIWTSPWVIKEFDISTPGVPVPGPEVAEGVYEQIDVIGDYAIVGGNGQIGAINLSIQPFPPSPLLAGAITFRNPIHELKVRDNYVFTMTSGSGLYAYSTNIEIPGDFFIDPRDEHKYQKIQIGNQTWMAENLAYIPQVSPSDEPGGVWVYDYEGYSVTEASETEAFEKYGCLYDWEHANSLCPPSWHLPSEYEWLELEKNLGMDENELYDFALRESGQVGKKLKATSGWYSNDYNSNESGFTALPGGSVSTTGGFTGDLQRSWFWTSSIKLDETAFNRHIYWGNWGVTRSSGVRDRGYSVRCVQDVPVKDCANATLNLPCDNSADDMSGNDLKGTIVGATNTTNRNDIINQALEFDGVDDYIIVEDHPLLLIEDEISIEAWIYPTDVTRRNIQSIIDKYEYAGYGLALNEQYQATQRVKFTINIDGEPYSVESATQLQNNRWYHVMGSYDGSELMIFLDGVKEGSLNVTGSIKHYFMRNPLGIGGALGVNPDNYNYFFKGKIDDVKIWNCAKIPNINPDRKTLTDIYYALDGDNWTNNTNWCSDAPLNEWYGVEIDNNRVSRLALRENNLRGNLPIEICDLLSLRSIDMSYNHITGSLPPTINKLTNLEDLSLGLNQLSGIIPEEITELDKLSNLSLAANQLTGHIPENIGRLVNLVGLDLCGNQLSGSIPSSIGDITSLNELWLGGNQLSGSIPSKLGNLSNLGGFDFSINQLTGTIPSELGNMSNLIGFDVNRNNLEGPIPASLGNLSKLQSLLLYGNQFESELPDELHQLQNLIRFEFQQNNFDQRDCDFVHSFTAPNLESFIHSPQNGGFDFGTDCAPLGIPMPYCQDFYDWPRGTNPLDDYGWSGSFPADASVYVSNAWTSFDWTNLVYLRNREVVDGVRIPIYLQTPGISVSGNNPVLTWNEVAYSEFNTSGYKGSPRNLYISTDGENFELVDSYLTNEMPDAAIGECWRTQEYSLSQYIGQTIWWKWELESVNDEYTYWCIDNVCFGEKTTVKDLVYYYITDYGQVFEGNETVNYQNFRNRGFGTINILSAEIIGDPFFYLIDPPAYPYPIVGAKGTDGPGCNGSLDFKVGCSPTGNGIFEAVLHVVTDVEVVDIPLRVQGIGCSTSTSAVLGDNYAPRQNTVFSYTTTGTCYLHISSCHPNQQVEQGVYAFDTYLQVFQGCGGDLVAENDDLGWEDCNYNRASSAATFLAEPNTTYYIFWPYMWADYIDDFAFTFTVEEIPYPGQSCEEAIQAQVGDNYASNMDIWYEYTAKEHSILDINSCHADNQVQRDPYVWSKDTYLQVYDGCSGNLIAENDDLSWDGCEYNRASAGVTVEVQAGQTIKIFWPHRWAAYQDNFAFTWVLEEYPCTPFEVNISGDPVVYLGYEPEEARELTAVVTGLDDSYTLFWSTGETSSTITVNPIVATNYTVTVIEPNGCTQTATMDVAVEDVRCGNNNNKVLVCSPSKGKKGKQKNLCISPNAVPSHLAKGATLGACNDQGYGGFGVLHEEFSVDVFPNPNGGEFTLKINQIESSDVEVRVLNILGEQIYNDVFRLSLGEHYVPFDMRKESQGIYFIEVRSSSEVARQTIILN